MEVVNCEQMREIDRKTIEEFGIPGIVLMENAAKEVVKAVIEYLENPRDKKVIIFAGRGNNGGDGLAVARHLHNMGAQVEVILTHGEEGLQGDSLINLNIIKKMGISTRCLDSESLGNILNKSCKSDIIIDSIFGTGIRGEIEGEVRELIQKINQFSNYTISVDIPSGVNGDTGEICGVCIEADETITFALPKKGLLLYPGADFVGDLKVVDISIPHKVIESQKIKIHMIEEKHIQNMLPRRKENSHKGDYGKIFIIAGSTGLSGAAALASEAALRSGGGLITAGIPKSLHSIIEIKLTEVMSYPLEDEGMGILSNKCIQDIMQKTEVSDVVAFGPGLSQEQSILEILESLLRNCKIPMVIDADGINALSKNSDLLKYAKAPVILTPHPGEMARLIGKDIKYVESKRIEVAQEFACKWKVYLILKGANTIIAFPTGEVWIHKGGNPGMAKGGSGDILTGIIISFIGQKIPIEKALVLGVFVHSMAGKYAAKDKGTYGVTPRDLTYMLPYVLQQLSN